MHLSTRLIPVILEHNTCLNSLPNVKDHRTVIIAFLRAGVGAKLHLSRGPMHPLVGLSFIRILSQPAVHPALFLIRHYCN